MTFEDKIKEMLSAHGLFENQALAIVKMTKADKINKPMLERWRDEVEDYPQIILALLWSSAKRAALEYIDANCPKAWFRPLFTEQENGTEL